MNIFTKWLSAGIAVSSQQPAIGFQRLLFRFSETFKPNWKLTVFRNASLLMTDNRQPTAIPLIAIFCLVVFILPARSDQIPIAVSGEPRATLQVGANASAQERFAAAEIQSFIQQFTGAKLDILTNRQQTETQTVIVLGTPKSNPTIAGAAGERRTYIGRRTWRRRLSYQNSRGRLQRSSLL